MPIVPRNPNFIRSEELGASHKDHVHAHTDLTAVTADQHHTELHAGAHSDGGADEITITEAQISDLNHNDANAIQNAIVDAKGDLISATAADTPSRLAVGANDTVLTADSAEATGLKWATASGGVSAHDILSASHTDVDDTDTPAHLDVLTWYGAPPSSAPVIRGVGTTDVSLTSITPGLPTGTTAGDLLLCMVVTLETNTVTMPDWNIMTNSPVTVAGAVELNVFWRIATGSGDAPAGSSTDGRGIAQVLGIEVGTYDAIAPFGPSTFNVVNPASATITASGITTTADFSLILAIIGLNDNGSSSGQANADLTSVTEVTDVNTSNDKGLVIISGVDAVAGTVGATTATYTLTEIQTNMTISIQAVGASGGMWVAAPSGVWQDWTPTITGITQGNGTVIARYTQIGKTVVGYFQFTVGSTTTMGNLRATLPVTISTQYILAENLLGQARLHDDSAGTTEMGAVRNEDANGFRAVVFNASGTYLRENGITSTVPFTWATGDILFYTFTYEAA